MWLRRIEAAPVPADISIPPPVRAEFSAMVESTISTDETPKIETPPPLPPPTPVLVARFPVISLRVTTNVPNMSKESFTCRMPPPDEVAALSCKMMSVSAVLSTLSIPPPEPDTSPPIIASLAIVTSIRVAESPSEILNTRLPSPKSSSGVGSFPEASIVSRSAPGPLIVSESVIASSPCVKRIVAGPAAVSSGANPSCPRRRACWPRRSPHGARSRRR